MTYYFYDLETTGTSPRQDRIMQFAGQRVSDDLEPIGDPDDFLIKITSDVLPQPEAILLTGITPQKTLEEGYSEKEFCTFFQQNIATPDTVFVGFNTIRFDDEFMRAMLYRNLYDPYEWQWQEGRSRWDILDLVRLTRALRPEGLVWPKREDGKPSNRLEDIARANNLDHAHAHNALSDVLCTIHLAKLIREAQPKLFDYLFTMRDKNKVRSFIESTNDPFVYSSGRFPGEYEHTTVVLPLKMSASECYVIDLRYNPEDILATNRDIENVPIKTLRYNQCPAVAPLNTMDDASWSRLDLSTEIVNKHALLAKKHADALVGIYEKSRPSYENSSSGETSLQNVDSRIYDGFIGASDKKLLQRIREMNDSEIMDFQPEFEDGRLPHLFFLYRARQLPKTLLAEDREKYDEYVREKLTSGGDSSAYALYIKELSMLASSQYLDADKRYILEELALYGQSLVDLDSF